MNILLIYNPSSGNGKFMQSFSKVKAFFKLHQYSYDIYDVRHNDIVATDMIQLAPHYDVCVVAGGDGTIHAVINGIMNVPINLRPRLLVLPYGTTNDFANMLGIGKDIEFNLTLLKTNHFRKSDVYSINDEYFIYAAAAGKFSNVSYKIDRTKLKKVGSMGYLLNARGDLFNKYKMDVEIQTHDLNLKRKAFLILIAAGSRVGGYNINKFTKNPKFNDGKVDIRIFTRNHILSWIKVIWFYLFKGRHFHNDIHLHTSYAKIKINQDYIWNIDGEAGPKGEIEIRVLQEQIEVYIHPKMIKKNY